MGPLPVRRVVFAHALLASALVLVATGCVSAQQPASRPANARASAVPLELPVTAVGLPQGVDLAVGETVAPVQNGENLDFVSPVYGLAPAGALPAPVTVSIELDNALPGTSTLFVASRDAAGRPWSLQRGRLTPDLRHVEFRTSRLNQVGVLSLELDGAVEGLTTDVRAGLLAGINRTVKKPTCERQEAALENGYSVASTKSNSLFWCFGIENDKRVVRVVNRSLVPVQVVHPEVPVLTDPRPVNLWVSWAKVLDPAATFLPPGSSATYDADLEPKSALAVTAASGVAAQSLRLLQAQVRAMVLRLGSFGYGNESVTRTVAALLARKRCAKSIGRGTDAMLTGCLSPATLIQTFGSRAQLLVPLVSAPAYPVFLRQQAAGMTAARPVDTQRVVVRRAAPDFTAFLGFWSGAGRMLAVNGEGLVTEQLSNEGQLVVKLTYQLEDPVFTFARSTARATLKAVEVGQRELLNGRVPRVGDTGTFTKRYGLLTPPFLKTTYCNESSAKRKVCQ